MSYLGKSNYSYRVTPSAVEKLKPEFIKASTQEEKWGVLIKMIGKNPSENDIAEVIDLLAEEPIDSPFRLDFLDNLLRLVKQTLSSRYLSYDSIAIKLLKKGNFDLAGVIGTNIESELTLEKIGITMASEMRQMTPKILAQKLAYDEIQTFLEAKRSPNQDQEISHFQERVPLIKKQIYNIFYGGFYKAVENLHFDYANSILLRYLLALNPLTEGLEYKLVDDIINVLVRLIRGRYSDENKMKEALITSIDYLKIHFQPKDDFRGYRNLLRLLDKMDAVDLVRVINRNFPEICTIINDKQELTQIMFNMVSSNLMNGPLQVIITLSENYANNRAFEYLSHAYKHVITPIIVQKIRVQRCLQNTLELCKIYFYGFAGLKQSLSPQVIEDFTNNLKYLTISGYKNIDDRRNLNEYLKFLEVIMTLYDNNPQDKNWIESMRYQISQIRKDNSLPGLSEYEMRKTIDNIKLNIWEVTFEDIGPGNGNTRYFTETLMLQYRTTNKITGISNIGNTCYLAATIQALFAARDFREEIIKMAPGIAFSEYRDAKKLMTLVEETAYMFDKLKKSTDSFFPYEFKEVLGEPFKSSKVEQDANEFITAFFDQCEGEMKKAIVPSIISSQFGGLMRYYFTCADCKKPIYQDEGFVNLYLNFDEAQTIDDELQMIRGLCSTTKHINEIDCDTCKRKSPEMERRVSLQKLPPYLIFTLNRFKFIQNERQKIFNQVEIYERIDFGELFPDQSQLRDNIYTLYAIIVHIGQTTDTGHYYTLIRDEKNEKIWYSLNDSLCYLIDNINKITDIFKSHTVDTPYMLFYKRTGKKQRHNYNY